MTVLLGTLCAISILLCMASLCRFFLLFDALLRRFHDDHRDLWEHAGKPTGFFWYPDGTGWFDSLSARGELLKSWRAGPPEWARGQQDLMSTFTKLTTCYRLAGVAIGISFVIFGLAVLGEMFGRDLLTKTLNFIWSLIIGFRRR